jgi:predicted MFS family arabinose efflux permease
MFNLVSGVALLGASVLAGLIWDRLGAAHTFWAGAAICGLTPLALAWRRR